MSVLYKALQKAEKDNEQRQSANESGFDPQRLAASGALKFSGGRGAAANRIIMAAIVVVAVAGGIGFLVFKDSLMSPAPQQVARVPASAPQPAMPVLQPPSAENAAATSVASNALTDAAATKQDAENTETVTSAEETVAAAEPSVLEAKADVVEATPQPQSSAKAPVATVPKMPASSTRSEPVPEIPADSPARMLNPPIAIRRAEIELEGVGNQVQVREVSQVARDNVGAGYDALMGGAYDTALGFYDRALADEPASVLALLGRGASLQKLGRADEAQAAYAQVLKLDPQNREALTNMTAIVGERSPQEALNRLLDLEHDYPSFSPIKAQLGLAYAKMGSYPQALDYFRGATVLSPQTTMYQYNMALVLDHMGRREQAIASYESVLAALAGGRETTGLSVPEIERRVRFLKAR